MNKLVPCPVCEKPVSLAAKTCPHCGETNLQTTRMMKDMSTTSAVAGGLTVGVGAGFWMVVVGILLSLTGIGALIGIPLILAGILMPLALSFGWARAAYLAKKEKNVTH